MRSAVSLFFTSVFVTLCLSGLAAGDPAPAVGLGAELRALAELEGVPALASAARAMAAARRATDETGAQLWQELLSQEGDADHAFRWTSANRAAVERAKTRFRVRKARYLAAVEDLRAAAAQSPDLAPLSARCRAERDRCETDASAFRCAPLLPLCLAQ